MFGAMGLLAPPPSLGRVKEFILCKLDKDIAKYK